MAEAMNYSMQAGGKRLRPILMQETYFLFGGEGQIIEPFMAAMEMIHTHSLIHDDLPALDNDDYRRGKLTTHKVYGEAMGVLSGVSLLNYAYETMLRAFEVCGCEERIARTMRVIAHKTGLYGMLGGQSVDVENDGKPITAEMLDYIYKNKTSALIEASMMAGAILAGADESQVAVIEKAAENIGLAFQIQDDILDVTSTAEELGKPVRSDEKNHKITYVTIFGLEEASKRVAALSEEAVSLLESLEQKNEFLSLLINELVNRRK
jgi:geranylgeranyl diphosphate synthase type II